MLLISFLGGVVTPMMMIVDAVKIHYSDPTTAITLESLYHSCSLYSMLLVGLIVSTVIAAYLFSREHTERTLKIILTIPVSKHSFIASKFVMLLIWVTALSAISWASMFVFALPYHAVFGIAEFDVAVAVRYLGEMLLGGVLLFLTISPFAFLALWTKGLVVPIIAATSITMGNAALTNEALGALYPWTASYLLVHGSIAQTGYSYALAAGLVAFVSILGFLASVVYFQQEDIK
jgi:bacitracin transport system permease protein